jgi:hypothetical protein
MSQRTDPYDDKYGAVVTSRTGEVTVMVDSITVTEPRRAGWEASDEQRALFIALETARTKEGARISVVECARAQAEWKAAAYATHVAENRKDERLAVKLAYWTAERDRLRERDGVRTRTGVR